MILIQHELNITYKLNCSFYAVLDGHGNRECVDYIGTNIIENFRDYIINSNPIFD